MYKPMTRKQVYAFIDAGHLTAHLATVRADGRPHVAPVWITTDGDDFLFNTGAETVKGRNLARTGYAALSLDNSTPPYDSVRIEGPVQLINDPEQVRHWATVLGGKYMGAEKADAFGARNAVPGELLVRLTPARISGIVGVADFHEDER